uniref:TonB-dependent receptor n=1 Tax=uncultured Sphingomonas sp. TaxID=158754 RepID=UPI0035C96227
MNRTKFVALASGVATLSLCQPVFAQEGSPPATPASTSEAPQSDATADIIVTANKRSERLQNVPISITVVDGVQLTRQNINEVGDLTRSAPSLNTVGPYGALSIRGVGSLSFARSAEGSVGVVVDGVALANTSANPPQLFDVARVEILEGPQGTLFGRNSSAGVLSIVTNAPDPTKVEMIAHADIATRNDYIGRAVLNLPVADNAALRVSGSFSQAPETQLNRFDNSWYRVIGKSGRARFKWTPSGDITINLIADYSNFERKGGAPWTVYSSTPGSLLTQRLAACGVVVGDQNQQGCIDGGNDTKTESYGFSGQVDMAIGSHTLTSISAYRAQIVRSFGSDADSVPVDRLNINASPIDIRNFSQELRLASPTGGTLEYVGGLYFFDSALNGSNTQSGFFLADLGRPFRVGQIITTRSATTSWAAFGQATVRVTPAFRLIAGGRYGNESVSAVATGVLAPGALGAFKSIAGVRGQISDDYFSYRLGAQLDVTRHVMLYGTYTKGYKGPSINDQAAGSTVPVVVQPEIPHAAEIGLKSTVLDGKLGANIALFYNRITNFQAQFFDPNTAQFIFGNAPKLTTKGVSVELFGRPLPGVSVNVGALYNDAKYGAGYFVACGQLETAAQGCLPVRNGAGAQIGTADDAGGNQLIGAPKWKVTGSGEYKVGLGRGLSSFAGVDIVYTSRVNFSAAYEPLDANAPAAIFGGRIGLRTNDDRYGISLFARNLFDTYRSVVRFATPTSAQQLDPKSYSQISGPESRRVVGLSLDAKF